MSVVPSTSPVPCRGATARLAWAALASLLLVSALAVGELALPDSVAACSCLPQEPGAPLFSGAEEIVFVGRAGQLDARGRYDFTVERWFRGGDAAAVKVQSATEFFADGTSAENTCGLHFEPGAHVILTGSLSEGVVQPSLCSPHAPVESEEGQRLLVAAAETFGEGAAPSQAPSDEAPGDLPLGGFALGLVGLLVLVIVIAVVASAWRRREQGPAA